MDTETKEANTNTAAAATTLGQDVRALLKHGLSGRRGVVGLCLAAAAVGLWFGWSSLVAAGIAPLLLGVLPCVAMCAFGLCMRRGDARSCAAQGGDAGTDGKKALARSAND